AARAERQAPGLHAVAAAHDVPTVQRHVDLAARLRGRHDRRARQLTALPARRAALAGLLGSLAGRRALPTLRLALVVLVRRALLARRRGLLRTLALLTGSLAGRGLVGRTRHDPHAEARVHARAHQLDGPRARLVERGRGGERAGA